MAPTLLKMRKEIHARILSIQVALSSKNDWSLSSDHNKTDLWSIVEDI